MAGAAAPGWVVMYVHNYAFHVLYALAQLPLLPLARRELTDGYHDD